MRTNPITPTTSFKQPTIQQKGKNPGWQEAVFDLFREIRARVSGTLFSASLLPQDPALRMKRLENGLTYYVRKNDYPLPGKASIHLVIRAGMLNEEKEQRGIAHLVEHIAEIETEKFSKHAIKEYLHTKGVRWGGDSNAYTSSEETVYHLDIPLDDPETLEKTLFILSQLASKATLSDEVIEHEREIVIDEMKLRQDVNFRFAREARGYLLEGTPYPSLDDREREIQSVKECPAETVRSFYRRWYHPENMAVIAVGDFDPDRTSRLIEKYFGKIPASPFPPSEHNHMLKTDRGTHVLSFSDPEMSHSAVRIQHQLPQKKGRGIVERENLERSLSSSLFQSMLNQRLSDLAQDENPPFIWATTSAGETITNWPSFGIGAQAKEGQIPQALKQLILEARRVKAFGFTKSEFERAKKAMMGQLDHWIREKGDTSTGTYIGQYKSHFLQNTSIPDVDELVFLQKKLLEGIDLTAVNARASDLMPQTNALITAVTPKKPGLSPISAKEIEQAIKEASKEKIAPLPELAVDQPLLKELPAPIPVERVRLHKKINVTEYTLKNGLRVLVKPTSFEKDGVSLHAASRLGECDAMLKDLVSAKFSGSFFAASGMGGFDRKTLEKMLQDKQILFGTNINGYATHIRASSTPQDLETIFQLFHLLFTNVGYERAAFERALKKTKENLLNDDADPNSIFSREHTAIITQNHPERKPLTYEKLKDVDYETSKQFHRKLYSNPADFTAVIVGNVKTQKVKELIERYLATIPGNGKKTPNRDYPSVPFPQGVIHKTIPVGKDPGAYSLITFPASIGDSAREQAFSKWCCSLLGERLLKALRFEDGKTYYQSCNFRHTGLPGLSLAEPPQSVLSFTGDPANLASLEKKAIEQIHDLQQNGPTEEEVAEFKKQIALRAADTLNTNSGWTTFIHFLCIWKLNQEEDPKEMLDKELAAFTPLAAKEHFQKIFPLDRYTVVIKKPK